MGTKWKVTLVLTLRSESFFVFVFKGGNVGEDESWNVSSFFKSTDVIDKDFSCPLLNQTSLGSFARRIFGLAAERGKNQMQGITSRSLAILKPSSHSEEEGVTFFS